MNNSSSTDTVQPISTYLLCQNIVLTMLGLLTLTVNTFICSTIYSFKKLRQRVELLIFSGLTLADIVYGIANASTSLQILNAMFHSSNANNNFVKPMECLHLFSALTTSIGTMLLPAMLLAVSIDRLLSILSSTFYHSLKPRLYVASVISLPFILSVMIYAVAWFDTLNRPNVTIARPDCNTLARVLSSSFYLVCVSMQTAAAALSVLVYFCVGVLYRRRLNQLPKSKMDARERRQIKLTKTIGFMTICTLVLLVLPEGLAIHFAYFYRGNTVVLQAGLFTARTLIAAYSSTNILVFLSRPGDVRKHFVILLKKLLFCKSESANNNAVQNIEAVVEEQNGPVPLQGISAINNAAPKTTEAGKSSLHGDANSIVGQEPVPIIIDPFSPVNNAMKYLREPNERIHVLGKKENYMAMPEID